MTSPVLFVVDDDAGSLGRSMARCAAGTSPITWSSPNPLPKRPWAACRCAIECGAGRGVPRARPHHRTGRQAAAGGAAGRPGRAQPACSGAAGG